MRSLVLTAHGRFALRDAPTPEAAPDEVLIRVKACGICGSDVHGMDGSTGRRIPPVTMGHEAAGIIEHVGAAVSGWAPGDRVTFDSTIYCGVCPYCRTGRVNLCDQRRVLGVSCAEYRRDGAFAEYVAVPARILYRLPEAVSFVQAAMVEPVSVAVHAVGRAPIRLGDTAAVVGTGMIGLLVVQALRQAGCGRIIAIDLDPSRLALAEELGADVVVPGDDPDLVARVHAAADGQGVHHAFEVVGSAPTLTAAIQCVRKGGSVVLVGNLAPEVAFPLQHVVTREITVYGSCASAGEYPACLDLIARGGVRVEPLLSATAPLEDGPEWFQRLYDKEPGLMKVVLCPEGEA